MILHEIGFFSVEEGERLCGVLFLRYSFEQGVSCYIVAIDVGTKEFRGYLRDHINEYYKNDIIDSFGCFHLSQDYGIPCLLIACPFFIFYFQKMITKVIEDIYYGVVFAIANSVAEKKEKTCITETWNDEKLVKPGENTTSNDNNSCVGSHLDFNGKMKLFTCDSGILVLGLYADFLEIQGVAVQWVLFVQQSSHYICKRGLGLFILSRLVGYSTLQETVPQSSVFISAVKKGNSEDSNTRVVKAFSRRGNTVETTQESIQKYCIPRMLSKKCLHYRDQTVPITKERSHVILPDQIAFILPSGQQENNEFSEVYEIRFSWFECLRRKAIGGILKGS
ncbi:MAG: hypothetical protein GY737_02900 [Desulfobacteraceae bacterium]|nr:hypothetical protein [Desulfobacteraceae bacterium]